MFTVKDQHFCVVESDGLFYAKKGVMVAYQGSIKFEKVWIGGGNMASKLIGTFVKSMAGESLEIMKVEGVGKVYLADESKFVQVLPLAAGQSICVESDHILAYSKNCDVAVTTSGLGNLGAKGLFTTEIKASSPAQVAIATHGKPLVLTTPCTVDPQALVAWTGPKGMIQTNNVNWKTMLGQTSGESYVMTFTEPGHMVMVQATEIDLIPYKKSK